MSSLAISEIVEKLKSAKTKTERADILKKNDCPALRGILRMNFDDSLVLALPEGTPPYKKLEVPSGFGNTTLKATARSWYVFVKELAPTIKQSKRESLFISLLENLDPKEAETLLLAKDRKLDVGLTKKTINEVFPGLIRAEGSKHDNKEKSEKSSTSSTTARNGKGV